MKVNYRKDGIWQTVDIQENGDCLTCGGIIEKNKWKKEEKHPDYKCSNRDCGAGYWLPKEKKPAHQIKPASPSVEYLLSQILEELKKLNTNASI